MSNTFFGVLVASYVDSTSASMNEIGPMDSSDPGGIGLILSRATDARVTDNKIHGWKANINTAGLMVADDGCLK